MLAILPLVLVSVALAAVVSTQAWEHRRRSTAEREIDDSTTAGPTSSLVRIGRVGDRALATPVRASVVVAPGGSPGTALTMSQYNNTDLASWGSAQIVMARGWSGGRLLVSIGKSRHEYGPAWPLGPNIAGWEIHLVNTAGDTVRCYGAPGALLDADLLRLQTTIGRARQPRTRVDVVRRAVRARTA
jgi:hypothetical protein